MYIILIAVIVTVVIVAGAYLYFKPKETQAGDNTIIGKSVDATKTIASKDLPKSYNQDKGITFSYTGWLLFEDFTYRLGTPKVIFVKGPEDMSSMCPGVFLDSNTNSILVKIDTFGAQEVISVPNIPAKKWVHFGLVVDQDSVDVYINGVLHTHHTLAQLPRQNPSPVRIGLGGGFKGQVSNLNYYNYFLTPAQVKGNMAVEPHLNQDDVPAKPPYSDISWWTTGH